MVKADKNFGQHFLVNDSVVARIADDVLRLAQKVSAPEGRAVVEIGPGPGALTAALLARGLVVFAVEIDRRMIEELGRRFAGEIAEGRFRLLNADALEVTREEIEGHLPPGPYVVCGNLPYNVGTPIVFRFLEDFPRAEGFCYMLQKEVVKKLLSEGGGDYGPPSVKMRLATDTLNHFWVSPGSFRPPPKVDSGVFTFRRKAGVLPADPLERDGTYDRLAAIVSRAFTQRRKMLRNSLPECAGSEWAERRPETLSPNDFLEILSRYFPARAITEKP